MNLFTNHEIDDILEKSGKPCVKAMCETMVKGLGIAAIASMMASMASAQSVVWSVPENRAVSWEEPAQKAGGFIAVPQIPTIEVQARLPERQVQRSPETRDAHESSQQPIPRENYKEVSKPKIQKIPPSVSKSQFIAILKPMIDRINWEIKTDRDRLDWIISHGGPKTDNSKIFISNLMIQYRVTDGKLETLRSKMGTIPASLAIAQAAVESGWGSSRLANTGNVLYGQKSVPGDHREFGKSEDGSPYAKYDSSMDSMRAYVRNLNSHPAYSKLRKTRHALETKGKKPTGLDLAEYLTGYSAKGYRYVSSLRSLISEYDLDKLD